MQMIFIIKDSLVKTGNLDSDWDRTFTLSLQNDQNLTNPVNLELIRDS